MARIEFKPPSDFVAEDSGGGKRSVWKWVGIGCGAVVVIVGILLAVGTWKGVSCCTQAMDSARLSMQAGQFGVQFARELAAGDVQSARAKMSESLAAEFSEDELQARIREHQPFLENAPARLTNITTPQADGEQIREASQWNLSVDFAPPRGDQKLVLLIDVIRHGEGEAEEAEFRVGSLQFDRRERELRSEQPAEDVLAFHRHLRAGNYERAYEMMAPSFAEDRDLESFRTFVREQNEVFRRGELEIQAVEYLEQNQARVIALAHGAQGAQVRIEYQLERPNMAVPRWRIVGVNPTYQNNAPTESGDAELGDAGRRPDAGNDPTSFDAR